MCLAFLFGLFERSNSLIFCFPIRAMQIESMEYEESPTTKYVTGMESNNREYLIQKSKTEKLNVG